VTKRCFTGWRALHCEGGEVTVYAAAGPKDAHARRQGLRFLHVTLAAMLNLRSPADSTLPGRSVDKLAASL
jgi:hypothetical protein